MACSEGQLRHEIWDAVDGRRQKPGQVAAVGVLRGMAMVLHAVAVLLALVVAAPADEILAKQAVAGSFV